MSVPIEPEDEADAAYIARKLRRLQQVVVIFIVPPKCFSVIFEWSPTYTAPDFACYNQRLAHLRFCDRDVATL